MLVMTMVKATAEPRVVVLTLAVFTMVSTVTMVVVAQRGSPEPLVQLLPGVAEVTVLARMWLPVSGLLTVTV